MTRGPDLANPELGAKQICPTCSSKFYDLTRRPAHCPKCGSEFDPEEALRSRCPVKQVLAAESAQNHRQFDRMALRAFYLPGLSSPQELNDIANTLRNIFEIRLVTPEPGASTLVVRAQRNVLDAATRLLAGLGDSRPQVMLDVHVYQITNTLTRNMGLQIPNNFQ